MESLAAQEGATASSGKHSTQHMPLFDLGAILRGGEKPALESADGRVLGKWMKAFTHKNQNCGTGR